MTKYAIESSHFENVYQELEVGFPEWKGSPKKLGFETNATHQPN